MTTIAELETPCAILDRAKLEANCAAMRERAKRLGVALRPHLKTSKSADVALIATGGARERVTVSTLQEAEYFAENGFDDILYAVPIAPDKIARAARLNERLEKGLLVAVDSAAGANAIAERTADMSKPIGVVIEIDCGDRRSGLSADDPELDEALRILAAAPGAAPRGVFTHAGHSYGAVGAEAIRAIAREERNAAVAAAERLRAAGADCDIVSIGSTPTATFADDLAGVTEMRPGCYVFQDLDQAARGVCGVNDIALAVLATVISHKRNPDRLITDTGGLAMSKDLGANDRWPHARYGLIADAETGEPLDGLALSAVSQEHGVIAIDDPEWFARLPLGARLRVLPNHACFTAAAYDEYAVLEDGEVRARWRRVNGWR